MESEIKLDFGPIDGTNKLLSLLTNKRKHEKKKQFNNINTSKSDVKTYVALEDEIFNYIHIASY